METEATTSEGAVPAVLGGAEADEVFGTRPATDRPHSLSLHGSSVIAAQRAARGIDVLLGVGIGAAIMYYLDPDAGAKRRARARDTIVQAVSLAPDAFEGAALDVAAGVRRLAADARATSEREAATLPGLEGSARQAAGNSLVATTIGSALALLATRRRDALGAAVALLGSTLLARGITGAGARRQRSISEEALEPESRELRDSL